MTYQKAALCDFTSICKYLTAKLLNINYVLAIKGPVGIFCFKIGFSGTVLVHI